MRFQGPEAVAEGHDFAVFHAAIGEALSGWAKLEHMLVRCLWATNGLRHDEAIRDFYGEDGFKSRLALVNRSVCSEAPPGLKQEWLALRCVIEDLAEQRHFMAHNPVELDATSVTADDISWRMIIRPLETSEANPWRIDHMTLQDVRTFSAATTKTLLTLRTLYNNVALAASRA